MQMFNSHFTTNSVLYPLVKDFLQIGEVAAAVRVKCYDSRCGINMMNVGTRCECAVQWIHVKLAVVTWLLR